MARRSPGRDDAPPDLARLHIWQIQAVRDLLWVAAAVGIVWLGYAIRSVTVPLLVALLLAYLFEPLVARFTRRRAMSRPFVVGALIGTVGVAVVAVLAITVPVAVGQTADFVAKFRDGTVHRTAVDLAEALPANLRGNVETWIDMLPGGPQPPPDGTDAEKAPARRDALAASGAERQDLVGLARGGVRAVGRVIGGVVQVGFLAFLIPFYFFFFSVSYPAVQRFARGLVPEAHRERSFELLHKMDRVVAGFVRGRIVISLIMGAMLAAGWWICGVPYALSLGVVVGIFCAVPYLGGIGIPLAVGLLAVKHLGMEAGDPARWSWWVVVLAPTAVFAVVQVIEGYVLTPLIAGKATNLDPVTILVAVLAGGSIMGVYGMLLAIPVTACLKILLAEVLLPRIRAWTKGEVADPLPIGGKEV